MLIDYLLADPTGNITALVESPVEAPLRQAAAASVMAAETEAEQLGFICPPKAGADIGLYMAGGEFCGNACLCAGAWYLRSRAVESASLFVDISGATAPVKVNLEKLGENRYAGQAEMPLPLGINSVDSPIGKLPIVRFPGISHVIVSSPLSHAQAEELIIPLCRALGPEALGLMLLDEESETMEPLVYVPGAGSMFWERSCASGTAAVGAYLAQREGRSLSLSLRQKGGSLSISAVYGGRGLEKLLLGGSVRLLDGKRKNFDFS